MKVTSVIKSSRAVRLIHALRSAARRALLVPMLVATIIAAGPITGMLPQAFATTYYCNNPSMSYSVTPGNTNSTSVTVNYSGLSCVRKALTSAYHYAYLFASHTDSSGFTSGNYSRYYQIYGSFTDGGGALNTTYSAYSGGSQGFDLSDGGHDGVAQGTATVYVGVAVCATAVGTSAYEVHSYTTMPGTCSSAGVIYTSTSTFYDTQVPTAAGHLNASCFTAGAGVQVIDGGSSDPSPTSGWNTTSGMWYYSGNGANSGWTNAPSWSFTAPSTTGGYTAYEYIRDNAGNQSAAYGMGYSVDNSVPSGGWVSASASTTNSTTVNLSFAANAGGCAGMNNVAISNNNANWYYTNAYQTSYNGWDFTNATYGGNANQGTHYIYVAIEEAGIGWEYLSTSLTYDSAAPTVSSSVPYTNYTNQTAFNTTYSASDATSGVSNWALYRQSTPVSGTACQAGSGSWGGLVSGNGAVSSTYANSGLVDGTCYQWAMNANDIAGNHGYQSDGEGGASPTGWVMVDTQLPTFRGSLNAINFVPGQSVTLTQSGSTDPTPGSGLSGQYYYENNWTDAVAWTTSNTYTDPVPTPAVGTQGTYNVEATAGDNAGNYQWLSNWSYCVDNTYPTGLSISGVPANTNSATVNVTTHSTAGGCAGVTNVRISNNGSTWLIGQVANGILRGHFLDPGHRQCELRHHSTDHSGRPGPGHGLRHRHLQH
jgi:hypothetical protein